MHGEPKTANPEHMRANARVDFEITDENMATLKDLHAQDCGDSSEFPVLQRRGTRVPLPPPAAVCARRRGDGTIALMTDQTAAAHTELWVERTGTRRYTGRSSRGAEVLIGSESVPGVFTPGELLKIALAACSAMSSDLPLSRRLGDDYDATVRVEGAADRDNEWYPVLHETLELDLSELAPDAQERLLVVVERAIDKVCTVGRTIKRGAEVRLDIEVDS